MNVGRTVGRKNTGSKKTTVWYFDPSNHHKLLCLRTLGLFLINICCYWLFDWSCCFCWQDSHCVVYFNRTVTVQIATSQNKVFLSDRFYFLFKCFYADETGLFQDVFKIQNISVHRALELTEWFDKYKDYIQQISTHLNINGEIFKQSKSPNEYLLEEWCSSLHSNITNIDEEVLG